MEPLKLKIEQKRTELRKKERKNKKIQQNLKLALKQIFKNQKPLLSESRVKDHVLIIKMRNKTAASEVFLKKEVILEKLQQNKLGIKNLIIK